MLQVLREAWFWAAVGAVVALLGFLFTHVVGKRRVRYWMLQRLLNRERSFYTTMPAPRKFPLTEPSEAATRQYVSSVAESLLGFDVLPPEAVKKTRDELRRLLSNLRATHQTLVSALEPFSLGDARKFFEDFDGLAAKFATLYHGGQIPHDARTHCSEVEAVISELDQRITGNTPGWREISTLRHSVVAYDRDVIVPLMVEVLERAQLELSIIGQAIRAGDFRKAISVKERFWFEVRGFYSKLDASLTKMSALAARM